MIRVDSFVLKTAVFLISRVVTSIQLELKNDKFKAKQWQK